MRRRTFISLAPASLLRCQGRSEWDEPFPPHRIADNLFYVGTKGLSSYLVTTREGLILINSSFERTVPKIRKSIGELGFTYAQVRILLGSHAHGDHMDGNFLVKEQTGAAVYVMKGDDDVIRAGRGVGMTKPCVVDKVLRDGDQVMIGGAVLTAVLTPGHTKGCTTWTMRVRDESASYLAVIVGSPNVNPGYVLVNNREYPEIAEDFAKSFRVWKSLPCDIFLGAHGDYYGMAIKYKRSKQNPEVNVWVDPEGYKAYINEREQAYLAELKTQRGG